MVLDRLDNDDGVIDNQADGQDEAEKGERVDGKAEEREEAKVPTSDTGTASSGMSVARQPCRKRKTTMIDKYQRLDTAYARSPSSLR